MKNTHIMKHNHLLSRPGHRAVFKYIYSLCMLTFMAGGSIQAQNTTLNVNLKGLSNDTVSLFYIKDGQSVIDTIYAKNDRFTWKANLKVPVQVALTVDSSSNYYFFAAPGKMQLNGTKDSMATYTLTGAPMQEDADTYRMLTKNFRRQWDALFTKNQTASQKEKIEIDKKRSELINESNSITKKFISDHPGSLYSLYLIGLERDYTTIKALYNLLEPSAKQTTMGKSVAHRLLLLSRRQIGQQMTDFTQADTSGHLVNFNQFKTPYKYILIDFWASWCSPCRAENPNVLKAYNAYKDKGFTVIGISLDDDANRWKQAINQDKMPWIQLSDLKGFKNELSARLGIEFIPSNLLIDPTGKIIARDLRGEDLENKLKELMD